MQTIDHVKNKGISYTYDALNQLVSATGGIEPEYKCPDAVGNLYETPERKDKTYSSGGRLERDKNWYYYYDTKGNLQLKSPYPLHGKDPSKKWQMGCWHYEWFANGMLKSVQKPSGAIVGFEYDALGRRTAKIAGKKITRYLWDGNVLLHEWSYGVEDRPRLQVGEFGELFYDKIEPSENLVTWVYEDGSFTPIAKLVDGERFSIVRDYLGTPIQSYNSSGELVWERELNIYGGVRKEKGIANFVAMRYQGQYFDEETGLCYNRFRYFESSTGLYISQDPIGLIGGMSLYCYSYDSNLWIDVFGLSSNSALLGQNLGSSPGLNHDAHHIIMTGTQNPKMNSLVDQMKAHGIDPDGKQNGIWLARTDADKITGKSAGTSHKQDGLHGNSYKDEIFDRLDGKNKKEFKAELKKIKEELKNGRTWDTKTTKKLGKVCR